MAGYPYTNQVTDPNAKKAIIACFDLAAGLRDQLDSLQVSVTPLLPTPGSTTVLAPAAGGTGLGSFNTGDLLVATSSTTLAGLAAAPVGNVLRAQGVGVPPAYGKVSLMTDVSIDTSLFPATSAIDVGTVAQPFRTGRFSVSVITPLLATASGDLSITPAAGGRVRLFGAPAVGDAYSLTVNDSLTNPITAGISYDQFLVSPIITQTANGGLYGFGVNSSPFFTGSGNYAGVEGVFGGIHYSGSGVLSDGVFGVNATCFLDVGAGVVQNVTGVGAFNVVAAGTITDLHGFRYFGVSLTGGSVTTHYGLRLGAITGGGTNYAIHTDAGLVHFGDNTQLAAGKTLKLQGATSGDVSLKAAATTTSYTLTLPDTDGASGDVLSTDGAGVTSWAPPSVSGANTALSNLAAVAINTTLVSDTNNTDDLGTAAIGWRTGYFATSIFNPLLYGSSAANGDITIEGTSHATKTTSYVILQPTSGFVGIGKAVPTANLDIEGTAPSDAYVFISVKNLAATGASSLGVVNSSGISGGMAMFGASFSNAAYRNRLVTTAVNGAGFLTDAATSTGGASTFTITTGGYTNTQSFIILGGNPGNIGIGGVAAPTSKLHLAAGTATAGTAPFGFTSGTLLTVPVAGKMEFLTDDYFLTITTGATRKGIVLDDGARLTATRVPFATTNGRLTDITGFTFVTDTLTSPKVVGTTSVKVGTAAGFISSDGSAGATGTILPGFTSITVKDGIITAIV